MEVQVINGITLEPSKPRMCMASILVNLFSKLPYDLHFKGLPGIVAALTALNLLVTFDAISAFSHIHLTTRSLKYAAFQVDGLPLAVYLAMWFGYRPASHVMQAFMVVIGDFIEVQHKIPIGVHIDDGALTAPAIIPNHGLHADMDHHLRFVVTCNAAYIVLVIFQQCGICIGLPKSNVLPEEIKKSLGLIVHCPGQCYMIPEDKRFKYTSLLNLLLQTELMQPLDYEVLRKFLGFIIFLSMACRPLKVLSKLFYKWLAMADKGVPLLCTPKVANRLRFFRAVLDEFESAPWRPPTRAVLCIGTHDSSSHTIGAWLCLPGDVPLGNEGDSNVFAATGNRRHVYISAPLPARFLLSQIDVKEYYSLLCLLLVLLQQFPWVLRTHKEMLVLGDNMHVLQSERRDGRGSEEMLEVAEEVELLQLRNHFSMEYGRITTKQNTLSDSPSRYIDKSDVQLVPWLFQQVWHRHGPVDFDGMASERTVQSAPGGAPMLFFSRFLCPTLQGMPSFQFMEVHTSCYAIDFYQQMWSPNQLVYVFPPFQDVPLVLAHLQHHKLSAVVLIYDEPLGHLPRYVAAASAVDGSRSFVAAAGTIGLRFFHHKTFTRTRDVHAAWQPMPLPFDLHAFHLPFSRQRKRSRNT
jgi:hypothetical protein